MEYVSFGANTLQNWLVAAWTYFKRRGSDGLTPATVVMQWNQSLRDGNMGFVREHTFLSTDASQAYLQSKTATKKWTSLEELSEKYRNGKASTCIAYYVSENIDKIEYKIAKVTYEVYYETGDSSEFQDILVKENGIWKIRLEHVRCKVLYEPRI